MTSYQSFVGSKFIPFLALAFSVVLGLILRYSLYPSLEGQYLLGTDPYFHLLSLENIISTGSLEACLASTGCQALPAPFLGVLGYISWVFLNLFALPSPFEVASLMPLIFFVLIIMPFYALVRRVFSQPIALLSTVFLAVAPTFFATVTLIGDFEKEPLGLFFLFSSFLFFLRSFGDSTSNVGKNYSIFIILSICLALTSRIFLFLVFVLLLYYLFVLFLGRASLADSKRYAFWLFSWVPAFIILSKIPFTDFIFRDYAYPLFFAVIIFLLLLLNLFSGRHLNKINIPPSLVISILGFIILLAILIIDLSLLSKLFLYLDFPMGANVSIRSLGEAFTTTFIDLVQSLSTLFLPFIIGLGIIFWQLFSLLKKRFSVLVFSFSFITFLALRLLAPADYRPYALWLLIFGVIFSIISIIFYYYKDRQFLLSLSQLPPEKIFLFLAFLAALFFASSQVHLMILLAPFACVAAALPFTFLYRVFSQNNRFAFRLAKIFIFLILIFFLAFSLHTGFEIVSKIKPSLNESWLESFEWLKNNSDESAVIFSMPDAGYWLNYYSGRKVVIHSGKSHSNWEAYFLSTLFTDEGDGISGLSKHADYLFLSGVDIFFTNTHEAIASHREEAKNYLAPFLLHSTLYVGGREIEEMPLKVITYWGMLEHAGGLISSVEITFDADLNSFSQPRAYYDGPSRDKGLSLSCLVSGKEKTFFDQFDLNACLVLLPLKANDRFEDHGLAFLVFDDALNFPAVQLYLFDENLPLTELVFVSREDYFILTGNDLIGPMKIWRLEESEET